MSHLNIFGCPIYVHIPKENKTKLDPSGNKGIFAGYHEVSKSFRIYILGFHHIEISRDVTFDEEEKAETTPEIVASEDHDMLEPQDPPNMDISRKRKPASVREIIQEAKIYGVPEGSTRTNKRVKAII